METTAPLTYHSSANAQQPTVSRSLPAEVVTCLRNARFVHLATCWDSVPHVSLMCHTFLSSTPFQDTPTIIMTTNPISKKTHNLIKNPRVSLLAHDWVSHRPPTATRDAGRSGSPPPQATSSSLATMLLQMNTSAMSRISVTVNGEARIVEAGTEEETWCKEAHLQNNTFGENPESSILGTSPGDQATADGGRGTFIEGEEVRVVIVKVNDGRIADWKGGVSDFVVGDSAASMVNGVS